jgi:hypothetical protein
MATLAKQAKRAFVTGYARLWPREIFDQRGRIANGIAFLEQPGVYVLYQDGRPHYIGKADVLITRIRAHSRPKSRYFYFWNLFSAFAVTNAAGRDELEAILIAAMPTANSSKPKLNKLRVPSEVATLMRQIRDSRLKS